jgi:dihydrolipoamide dehydrogenase
MLRKSLPDVNFILGAQVTKIDGSKVYYQQQGKPQESLPADTVLLSVGRRPNCADIGLERVGIEFDRSGIRVNDKMQTNIPGVYAVGDVNGKSLLAHSAYRMGEVAVNIICGRQDHLRLEAIPSVVYTDPEVAVVGLTETQAKEQGRAVRTARLPLKFNGRSLAEHGDVRGLCTVVVDADTSVLLGVQMLGTPASEIIFGAAAMIEAELRVQDIKEIVFPHPSVSEILRDTLFAL